MHGFKNSRKLLIAMDDTIQLMLRDYIKELLVLLREAQKDATHRDTFSDGRRMGLYEALSLALDTAKQFGITPEALGHADIKVDSFLK